MNNNLYGFYNLQIKKFVMNYNSEGGMEQVNKFLKEHDGNIIDIQTLAIADVFQVVIIYQEV